MTTTVAPAPVRSTPASQPPHPSVVAPRREAIALISAEGSPALEAEPPDANPSVTYPRALARHLPQLGYTVGLFTRREQPDQPRIEAWVPGVRIVRLNAGPPRPLVFAVLSRFAEALVKARGPPDTP